MYLARAWCFGILQTAWPHNSVDNSAGRRLKWSRFHRAQEVGISFAYGRDERLPWPKEPKVSRQLEMSYSHSIEVSIYGTKNCRERGRNRLLWCLSYSDDHWTASDSYQCHPYFQIFYLTGSHPPSRSSNRRDTSLSNDSCRLENLHSYAKVHLALRYCASTCHFPIDQSCHWG